MSNNYLKGKLLDIVNYIFTGIIHGTIPFFIDKIFHDSKLFIQFFLLIIPGILIYTFFNAVRTRVKKKIWENIRFISFCLCLGTFLILLYLGINYFSTTENGFTYFKGKTYTANAIEFKAKYAFTDDELVESVSNKVNLVWIDSENMKSIFLNILMPGFILWDIYFCTYLLLRKFVRTKRTKP